MKSEDITKLPYAPWLENAIRILTEHHVHAACIVATVDDGDTMTGYWNADAQDKAIFAHNIQSDIVLDIVQQNADIIKRAMEEADAGLDLYAPCGKTVPAKGSAVFDTGVHVQIPVGMVGFLKSKSGLNVKYGITSEGVIDSGFTGSIVAKLYNNSDEPYTVRMGDKITQLVILPIYSPELELVETFEETERGSSGFGSTGR